MHGKGVTVKRRHHQFGVIETDRAFSGGKQKSMPWSKNSRWTSIFSPINLGYFFGCQIKYMKRRLNSKFKLRSLVSKSFRISMDFSNQKRIEFSDLSPNFTCYCVMLGTVAKHFALIKIDRALVV